jgi:hypothetical protein
MEEKKREPRKPRKQKRTKEERGRERETTLKTLGTCCFED